MLISYDAGPPQDSWGHPIDAHLAGVIDSLRAATAQSGEGRQ